MTELKFDGQTPLIDLQMETKNDELLSSTVIWIVAKTINLGIFYLENESQGL